VRKATPSLKKEKLTRQVKRDKFRDGACDQLGRSIAGGGRSVHRTLPFGFSDPQRTKQT
jgi:hypothetical protein